MEMAMQNLKSLREDMREQGWQIASFLFSFNNCDYIVLVHLYKDTERRPQYALVNLEFLREEDINQSYRSPANSNGLMLEDVKGFREFFHIKYSNNLGDIIQQFSERLGLAVPKHVSKHPSDSAKSAMVKSLSNSDAEDPNRIYCYKVKRNPVKKNGDLGERSIYNDNKTRLLREDLYGKLGEDKSLSFHYSLDMLEEKTDAEIIRNWANNN
ncbi:MAG: DUF6037 family protein [Peptococcaceae bacterium]|nr:DUF6037 family protein [Peptococcaceae bacterium]